MGLNPEHDDTSIFLQTSKNSILTLILSLLSLLLFLCLNLFKRNIKLLQAGRESEEVVRVQPYLC